MNILVVDDEAKIRAIIRKYGSPEYINVEVADELGRSFKERDKLTKLNRENEKERKNIEKKLESVGVGYRFQLKGAELVVTAGYSHPVTLTIPEGIKAEVKDNTQLTLSGIDKELLGEFAAQVRKVRKPEPYKGKGIRYKGEFVRRKEGKTAGKK